MARCWAFLLAILLSGCDRVSARDLPFPDLKASTLTGEPLPRAHFAGKPWIINVWVPGCSGCTAEFPALDAARAVWEPRGVGFLAVSIEPDRALVEAAVERLGIQTKVATSREALLTAAGATGVPSTLMVSADGRLIGVATGARSQAFFERQAEQLLSLADRKGGD